MEHVPDGVASQGRGVLSVTELNARVRVLVEGGLGLTWVGGEISNFTRAASGHCYFSLKDEAAQVRCVMFRGRAQLLDWQPANGAQVEVRASASFYEPRGEFQLRVDFMRRAGLGALYEAFERLKRKLAMEGLFDAARKRPIPTYARVVGVITSPRAAALRDVLST
ncbi:MAG: exodeoxyribonuclease VII large subunit, partial [Betaproteobacteria bacterium]